MSDTVLIYAELKPKPEHFRDVRDALLSVVDPSRAEPGCLRYDVFAIPELRRMALIGEWTDQAAYGLHHATPRLRELFVQYEQWLKTPPHVVRLEDPAQADPAPD